MSSFVKRTFSTLLNPRANLDQLPHLSEEEWQAPARAGRRVQASTILSNFPLMFGGFILFGLFLLVLFGPVWAPINPYIAGQHVVPHLDFATGEWIEPPLAPSATYPLCTDQWGNDILSMLMYGARNTLVAAVFIAMARIILGLGLGTLAGWNENEFIDRFIMGVSGVIMAIPMLISSMILIYALDIRRKLPVFIVALSIIGWTEIAQYIRSKFLLIRKKPYIEGARSVGATGTAIAVRHALPNLLPQLLVIMFLELGAVLLLMGELAFIGVFIGGGSSIALGDEPTGIQIQTLAEVPEWGAMLADGYRWLTAKPFIIFPPAMAFFIAIVGFNAFGEGLRRLLSQTYVSTNFLLRKRMILVVLLVSLATVYIISNTGPAPWFAKMAQAFAGEEAFLHTQALVDIGEQFNGRSAGHPGGDQAATYIAEKFESYGLLPGWRHLEYIYPIETSLTRPLTQPELTIIESDGRDGQTFTHQLDFGFMVEDHGGGGEAELPLTFVGFNENSAATTWESFAGLDLRDRIVLLAEGNAPESFANEALIRGAQGILWVTGNGHVNCAQCGRNDIRSQVQLAYPDQNYMRQPRIPIYRIRPATAADILESAGTSLDNLLNQQTKYDQSGPGWYTQDLATTVRMSLSLSEPEDTAVPTVLGYLQGSDFSLAGELVVIVAHYDGLNSDPDGTQFPAANHNASGISLLLEVARLWQEQALDPRRPVLFIAWGGGQLDNPGIETFLADQGSFFHLPTTERLTPTAVFQLDNVGAGGAEIFIHPESSPRLTELVRDTAVDLDLVTTSGQTIMPPTNSLIDTKAPWIYLSWKDADISPEQDTIESIDPEKLRTIGELLSLSLAKIVRQSRY